MSEDRKILDITDLVRQAQKDLLELKSRQIVGTHNIKVFESQSGATWDINQNVNLSTTKALWGYFIADTQPAPFAEFVPEIQLNNVPYNTSTDTRLNEISFGIDSSFLTTLNPTLDEAKKLAFYRLTLSSPSYPATINVKIKFRVLATDFGTVGGFV